MNDDLTAFRNELLARVRVRASADQNFTHSAFVEISGQLLEEAEEISNFEPCYFRGTGLRRRSIGIDGYSFDDVDGSIRLVIAEFDGATETKTITQTTAKTLFARAIAFVEDALAGRAQLLTDESTKEHGLASDLQRSDGDVARYRFYLATDGLLSDRVRDWPEGHLGKSSTPAEFHIWDVSRFHRAHLARSGRDELVVNFADIVPGGLPSLPASVDTDEYAGHLCVIPGAALADVYDTYGSRLLEGNVRAFLSTAGKVNKGIQVTIENAPQMFFAYNNGIAATASEVVMEAKGGVAHLISAKDFQIVNGGQTTASLAFARRKNKLDLSRVFVQMKLSVVEAQLAGQMIPLISRYANSQNKVSEADFFANHEFHRKMEEISRRLRAPAKPGSQLETFWFYERARGQYTVEISKRSPADRKRFETEHPRDQVMTKTDIAKVLNSWQQLPHEVSKGAQKNFLKFAEAITRRWEQESSQFNDEFFRSIVAHTIVVRTVEKLIPKEDWYDGGYRANVVTYTVAKLAHLIESKGGGRLLNTPHIWKEQRISDALATQLRAVAKEVFRVIIKPDAGIQNVTEWSKKEVVWQRVRDLDVPLVASLKAELVSAEEIREKRKVAKDEAKIDASVDALGVVLGFGHTNWERLRKWASEKGHLTPDDERVLRVACNPKWYPTDAQAVRLVKLLSRMKEEGFQN